MNRLALLIVFLLASFAAHASECQVYYDVTQAQGLPGWKRYINNDFNQMASIGSNSIGQGVSGPAGNNDWPYDPNHISSADPDNSSSSGGEGAGWVHLFAFAYRANGPSDPYPLPAMDLRGKKFVIDITIADWAMQGKGDLGLWIQGFDPTIGIDGRYLNLFNRTSIRAAFGYPTAAVNPYGWTGHTAPIRRTVEIPFSSNFRDWISMGTSWARRMQYAHWQPPYSEALDRILNNGWLDMGIIAIQRDKDWTASNGVRYKMQGKFTIHRITIEDQDCE